MEKIYLIQKSSGHWDDFGIYPLFATKDKELAENWVNKQNLKLQKLKVRILKEAPNYEEPPYDEELRAFIYHPHFSLFSEIMNINGYSYIEIEVKVA